MHVYKPVYAWILGTLLAAASPCGMTTEAGEMAAASVEKAVDAGFSELERQLIERYFGRMPAADEPDPEIADRRRDKSGKKKLPPGLAKRDTLPPGLAKRETLPPGLARRDLPPELERDLPPPAEGYERTIVDDAAVVLVNKITGKVADIINNIIIPEHHD